MEFCHQKRAALIIEWAAAEDIRAADTGMFLADGAPPAELVDGAHGVLVVTGRARLELARTEVRSNHGRQRVPTELAGFTATAEPRVR
ncbi:hypothetical protein AB0C02_04970 [Micromonospora sp. NPDC048999]|uniref:hypothetical protein n=1 Tax=Micromonospora sp. NPDC048999 TaxID=3155391 RepID=UPI0033E053FD